ncbi:ArsR/SmtB family transcription factor [Arthrobacter sp.]|uniref:ArsR/SmtB family transcription factor n=1 Tax=Arthrobacter sp. TaxID=1667 RepID=UPI003A93A07F
MTEILGVPHLRAAILRHLAVNEEGGTSGEIAGILGTRYQTVQRHLEHLEQLGAVVASVPPPRQGHRVVFRLDRNILADAIRTNAEYIQGH